MLDIDTAKHFIEGMDIIMNSNQEGTPLSSACPEGTVASRDEFCDLPARERRIKARQLARSVLPNCTETKLVMSMNVRSLREMLEKRGSLHAEPEIRRLAIMILRLMQDECPACFQDMQIVTGDDGREFVKVGKEA